MPSGSSPFDGSSSTSTWGSPSNAVARESRWRMPREKSPVRRLAAGARPVSPSTSSARWSGTPTAAAYTRRWVRAVCFGWKPPLSSTAPTTRPGLPSSWCRRPLMVATPAVGSTSPRIIRSVVVLPEPFGPRNPVTLPGSTAKLRFCTAVRAPNCLVRFCTAMRPLPSCMLPSSPRDRALAGVILPYGPLRRSREGFGFLTRTEGGVGHDRGPGSGHEHPADRRDVRAHSRVLGRRVR